MNTKVLAFLLVGGCIAAAGTGAFLATRHGASADPAATRDLTPAPEVGTPGDKAVSETEGVVVPGSGTSDQPAPPGTDPAGRGCFADAGDRLRSRAGPQCPTRRVRDRGAEATGARAP